MKKSLAFRACMGQGDALCACPVPCGPVLLRVGMQMLHRRS